MIQLEQLDLEKFPPNKIETFIVWFCKLNNCKLSNKTSASQAQLIKSSPGGLKVVIESLETNSENAIIMIVIHLIYVNNSYIVLQD